jgi:hypothetical protein
MVTPSLFAVRTSAFALAAGVALALDGVVGVVGATDDAVDCLRTVGSLVHGSPAKMANTSYEVVYWQHLSPEISLHQPASLALQRASIS